uniref:UPAR/Ly6 domain-containing protein n=1 Tax=Branchiostoma floridae TaxID=7739 RepID=C3Z1K0_BRAFL|eukprot:XP_002597606.1 hypothetical protein BRAFLDRAFT_82291 [Branchiostoma floridae]
MAGAGRLQLPVLALGLLLMAVQGTDGLRCYSCSATTGHPCQHDPAGLGPSSVRQCDASSDSCVSPNLGGASAPQCRYDAGDVVSLTVKRLAGERCRDLNLFCC